MLARSTSGRVLPRASETRGPVVAQNEGMDSAEARIIHARLDGIVSSMERLAGASERMQETLHVLTEIRTQQTHILTQLNDGSTKMGDHERRIQSIERDLPGLRELRKWVVAGVIAGIGMMGAALVKLVLYDPTRPPPYIVQPPQTQSAPK